MFVKVKTTSLVPPTDVAVAAVSMHDRIWTLIRTGHSSVTIVQPLACSGTNRKKDCFNLAPNHGLVFFLPSVGLTSASFVKTLCWIGCEERKYGSNSAHEIKGKARLRKGVKQREENLPQVNR